MGRRDSTSANLTGANNDLPNPTSNLSALITTFSNKGFTAKEMVALSGVYARCVWSLNWLYGSFDPVNSKWECFLFFLSNLNFSKNFSGAHTIGQARCVAFRDRLYNDNDIDSTLAASLASSCPSSGGDDSLSPLDAATPTTFDNVYFKNLQAQKGLLHSDQQLYSGGSTNSQVTLYAVSSAYFRAEFAIAMVKMGNLSPLTGSSGQIRTNCRAVNWLGFSNIKTNVLVIKNKWCFFFLPKNLSYVKKSSSWRGYVLFFYVRSLEFEMNSYLGVCKLVKAYWQWCQDNNTISH